MKLESLIKNTFNLKDDINVLDTHGPGQLDGWDSLGNMRLFIAIEKTYQISIAFEEIMIIKTVLDIKKLLGNKGVEVS
ncbi:acyl carrier protein [Paenibacillus sp. JNUCC32]|uniref:acyl carrier protein n=1 Tax=Paenibacillus TaxID=44249 RepID=UPI001787994B|nr:acyl carrier protein [Paenibacillus sp. JNUCC-32]QOT08094.1 acyl carrier protein [Paenibacillus sp. JNUCC-32]